MRESDDVGERGAQLVGHMLDESAFQPVRVLQRIGTLDQRALDIDRVGHVLERHQRGAVGQRYGRAVEHGAVEPFEPRRDRFAAFEPGDGAAQLCPERVVGVQRAAPAEHGLDMRVMSLFAAVERRGRQAPLPRESRIVQIEPPVAAEHGDALGERFERFALHADQRLVAAHQLQPLGHVVEEVSDAAFRIGRGDDAQRASVGQMPFVRARLERAIGFVQLAFPVAEICLFGNFPRGAQTVEHGGVGRLRIEERRVEPEQHAIGRVVECEPLVGGKDRDRGRELVERAPVRVGHALDLGADRLDLGDVDADAGAAARRRAVDHLEKAPRAGDDHRQARLEHVSGRAYAGHVLARGRVENFEVARHRVRAVACLHGTCVGGIHPGEPSARVARPYRRGQRLEEAPERIDVAAKLLMVGGERGKLALAARSGP